MNTLVKVWADANKCNPIYQEGILGARWHCGCVDNRHGCDPQCSIIEQLFFHERGEEMDIDIRPTRFPELGYCKTGLSLWRIVDTATNQAVGPHYVSEVELLADLERYGREYTGQ